MGNENSKESNAATSLSSKKLAKLKSRIEKEYPWLQGVEESMLITDMREDDEPIVYANEDFHKMTQYSNEEIIGFNCRFLQGKHTNPLTVTRMREAINEGKELEVEILNYRKDGTPFLNNFILLPLHSKKKEPSLVTYYLAVQKDVTYLVQENDPNKWKSSQIALWLEKAGYEEFVEPFIKHEIQGEEFLQMDSSKLQEIGITDSTIRSNILSLIELLLDEGPGFVYEMEGIPSLFHSNSDNSTTDSYTPTPRDYSSKNSENSTNEYNFTSSRNDGTDDVYIPKPAAYWRRQSLSGVSPDEPPSKTEPRLESPPITFKCFLPTEKLGKFNEETFSIPKSSLLYHLKSTIKSKFNLTFGINISIKINDSWKPIISQQIYKSLLKKGLYIINYIK